MIGKGSILAGAAPVADLPSAIAEALFLAEAFARNSRAPATGKVYDRCWAEFRDWCASCGLDCLPASPETIALYLAVAAQRLKVPSLQKRLAAIAAAHRRAGYEFPDGPALAEVWKGIKRTKTVARQGKMPLLAGEVKGLISGLPENLAGRRDRALILLGFVGAFRRSELVALDLDDIAFQADGMLVRLRRGKTDQEGAGGEKWIPRAEDPSHCPLRAVQRWILYAGLDDGPLFRAVDRLGRPAARRLSGDSVARIIQARVERSLVARGFTGTEASARAKAVAAHSLRSGLCVSALAAGTPEAALLPITGHRSRRGLEPYTSKAIMGLEDHPARNLLK
jgi:integrase